MNLKKIYALEKKYTDLKKVHEFGKKFMDVKSSQTSRKLHRFEEVHEL